MDTTLEISIFKNEILNMSKEGMEIELLNLKTANCSQQKQIEEYEQQNYELKRQLSTTKAMGEHLAAEIETLQGGEKLKFEEYTKKITSLEETIAKLKEEKLELAQNHEVEIAKKNHEIQQINEMLKNAESNKFELTKNEKEKYENEIFELKSKIIELLNELSEQNDKLSEILMQNSIYKKDISEYSKQLSEMKECFQVKSKELKESNDFILNLQDEITVLKTENDNLKSVPLDKAEKGNSLFAEVDDNRLKLQKRIEIMNKQFSEIKFKYNNKCQELQKVHIEYAKLITEIKAKNEYKDDQKEVETYYKKHIAKLNETIKSLENDLANQKTLYDKLNLGDMVYAMEMISVTQGEVHSLQKKLNSESLNLAYSEQLRFETKRELNKYKTETMELRATIVSLNGKIDELSLKSPPPLSEKKFNEIDDKETSNAMKKEVTLKNAEQKQNAPTNVENKENESEEIEKNEPNISENVPEKTKKAVTFTEDTTDNVSSGRFGRRIINMQPVHYPSIKK